MAVTHLRRFIVALLPQQQPPVCAQAEQVVAKTQQADNTALVAVINARPAYPVTQ